MFKKIQILIFLVYACACVGDEKISISLYRNEDELQAVMLAYTPKGSDLAFVKKFISEDLEFDEIVSPQYMQSTGVMVQDKDDPQITNIVGNHSIELLLGTYRDPKRFWIFETDVYVQWAFDEKNKLIDLFVYKYTQPP